MSFSILDLFLVKPKDHIVYPLARISCLSDAHCLKWWPVNLDHLVDNNYQ